RTAWLDGGGVAKQERRGTLDVGAGVVGPTRVRGRPEPPERNQLRARRRAAAQAGDLVRAQLVRCAAEQGAVGRAAVPLPARERPGGGYRQGEQADARRDRRDRQTDQ